jgi:hypothetical protein
LGEATHAAILEPDLFDVRYAEPPAYVGDGRSKESKDAKKAWEAAHPKCVYLKPDDYKAAKGMNLAVRAHAEALRYISGPGMNEVTLTWTDEETGEPCKCRPDRLTKVDGWTWIVDVKTCRSASVYGFSKAIAEYGYHRKAAFYLDAADLVEKLPRRFLFLAVESEPPHCVALYELTEEAIEQGRRENRKALALLAVCKKSKSWPGYPGGINYIDLPRWAMRELPEEA